MLEAIKTATRVQKILFTKHNSPPLTSAFTSKFIVCIFFSLNNLCDKYKLQAMCIRPMFIRQTLEQSSLLERKFEERNKSHVIYRRKSTIAI